MSSVFGAEGNLLLNGSLTADQAEVPSWWDSEGAKRPFVCETSGGPGGTPAVRFESSLAGGRRAILRQYGLRLASNGTYRVSCRVRARGFLHQGNESGFLIVNDGWTKSWGVPIPDGTYDWQRVERTVMVKPSRKFGAAISIAPFEGEISFADMCIEPADAETAAATQPSDFLTAVDELRLVPRGMLLQAVPEATRKIRFDLYGKSKGVASADCCLALTCGNVQREFPYPQGPFELEVPSAPNGGTFELAVLARADGRKLHSRFFDYRTIAASERGTVGRKLNTLVTEFCRERLAVGAAKDISFTLPVPGWVFVSVAAESVEIDGRRVIAADTPRHETFRQLTAGRHVLSVRDAEGGELILRQIPELFDYCTADSVVKEGPKFDWAFYERHVLPAVTVLNGGNVPDAEVSSVRVRGYRWLANLLSRHLTGPDDLVGRIRRHPGMNEARYDGVTCDEQFFQDPKMISYYARGLWNIRGFEDRSIYTWIVGRSTDSIIDRDFIAAAVNVSRGTGKLLSEIYCSTCPTEEEAYGYLRTRLVDAVADMRATHPWALSNYGVILGNYTQYPRISLAVHPEVDYRYYLDMQFNLIANDSAFEGLGCTGVWGSYYADAELHRWTFMLMRHYFVEGRREMLSERYGFRYQPGHLADGDFQEGLAKWAVDGTVTAAQKQGLGQVEGRWHSGTTGDTYACFVRQSDKVSILSQKLKGLVPGKLYAIGFMTFDGEFRDRRVEPRDFGVDAFFASGAKVRDDLSWNHINRMTSVKESRGPFDTKVNYRYIVFEAVTPEAVVVFSDKHLAIGETTGINGVSVRPYLPVSGDQQ